MPGLHVPVGVSTVPEIVHPRLLRWRGLFARQSGHGSHHFLQNTHARGPIDHFIGALLCCAVVSTPFSSDRLLPEEKKKKKTIRLIIRRCLQLRRSFVASIFSNFSVVIFLFASVYRKYCTSYISKFFANLLQMRKNPRKSLAI